VIKELLLIGIIAVAVFGVFMLYNNNWNFDEAFGGITGFIAGSLSSFFTLLQTNPIAALTMIGSGAALCIPFAKLAYDGLKKESTEKITNLSNVVVDKNTEIEAVKNIDAQKITDLEAQIEELKLENPDLENMKNKLFETEQQVKRLTNSNQGIQDMHTSFVNKLASASNNTTVIDPSTNQIYKVIKIIETQVK